MDFQGIRPGWMNCSYRPYLNKRNGLRRHWPRRVPRVRGHLGQFERGKRSPEPNLLAGGQHFRTLHNGVRLRNLLAGFKDGEVQVLGSWKDGPQGLDVAPSLIVPYLDDGVIQRQMSSQTPGRDP